MNPTQELVVDLLTARAAELARSGDYDAAESLLSPMSNVISESANSLDLVARIRAQQGALTEAETLWTKALQLSPGSSEYDNALERVAKARRWPRYYLYGRTVGLSVFLLVLIAAGAIGVWKFRHTRPFQAAVREMKGVPPQDALSSSPTATESQTSNLEQSLRLDGVSTKKSGNEIVLTFRSGLFSQGVRLHAAGREILNALARTLESHSENVSIQIDGLTDDLLPPARKGDYNSALALHRALIVAEYMRRNSRLPMHAITIGYGDQSQCPFPNDSSEHRRMNRSAIVRVGRKSD